MGRESIVHQELQKLIAAPLRNRVRVWLQAAPQEVWSLLGDLSRFPEYSFGLERVDVEQDETGNCAAYVCHFKSSQKVSLVPFRAS
jgi:uncharacterized membrane protein